MWLTSARDIAIIVLAFESLVIGGLLIFLLYQIWRLVRLLQTEIKPLLDNANETLNTMRGTTSFVSENVVNPVVRVYSAMAGVNGVLRAFVKPGKSRPPQPTAAKSAKEQDSEGTQ